jgi:hypothetical protein
MNSVVLLSMVGVVAILLWCWRHSPPTYIKKAATKEPPPPICPIFMVDKL